MTLLALVAIVVLGLAAPALAKRNAEGGRGDGPVVYVTSQDLYFDSIVVADSLPWKGRFQKLEMRPTGLQTEFGHGDHDYVEGRWWVDTNSDGEQDAGDHYFLCPLLGPGRTSP